MVPDRLYVCFDSSLVGTLTCSAEDEYAFSYDADWLCHEGCFALSRSLPLSDIPCSGYKVRSFFGNLLPEATVRAMLTRRLGVSESNDYALLALIGRECAGALSLAPERPDGLEAVSSEYESLDEDRLAAIIKALPQAPFLSDEEGVSMSLAGAQNKLPLFRRGDDLLIPKGGAPSNCMIKLPIPSVALSVENEYFCMQLAARAGLPCARTQYRTVDGMPMLLADRYDRFVDESGHTRRLHQEDFCQALGLAHERKYEADGGPSFKDCAEVIRSSSSLPLADLKEFLRWAVFNVCVGNMDVHAKNISFLYTGGKSRLAPFYDLLSTLFYGRQFKKSLAMKIGGQDNPRHVMKHHWEQFARDIQISAKAVLSEVGRMADELVFLAESMELPELPGKALQEFRRFVVEQCRQVRKVSGQ